MLFSDSGSEQTQAVLVIPKAHRTPDRFNTSWKEMLAGPSKAKILFRSSLVYFMRDWIVKMR